MEMSTRNLVQKIFILLLVLAFATFTKGQSPCSPSPCENGGSCYLGQNNSYRCACSDEFAGQNCSSLSFKASIGIYDVESYLPGFTAEVPDMINFNAKRLRYSVSLTFQPKPHSIPTIFNWTLNGTTLDRQKSGGLSIRQGSLADEGEYQFFMSNEFGTLFSRKVKLKFAVAGAFLSPNKPINVSMVENEPYRLRCPPRAYSYSVEYDWKANAFQGVSIANNPSYAPRILMEPNGDLLFSYVKASDFDTFISKGQAWTPIICGTRTRYFDSASGPPVYFYVTSPATQSPTSPPKFYTRPQGLYNVLSRGQFYLNCTAGGRPVPQIRWYRNGVLVNDSGDLFELQNYNRTLRMGSLSSVSHGGKYRCEAVSGLNKVEADFDVSVIDNVSAIYTKPFDRYDLRAGKYGGSVTMFCNTTGHPITSRTWYYNGVELQSPASSKFAGRWSVDPSNGALTIWNLRLKDFGFYQCLAKNILSENDRKSFLVVTGAPLPPINITTTNCANDSTNLTWDMRLPPDLFPPTSFIIDWRARSSDKTTSWGNVKFTKLVEIPDGSARSYMIKDLKAYNEIQFRIRAKNKIGVGFPGMMSSSSPPCNTNSKKPSLYPENLQGVPQISDGSLRVNWTALDRVDWSGKSCAYRIFYRLNEPNSTWNNATRLLGCYRNSNWFRGLLPNSEYEIAIRAENNKGPGPSSPIVRALSGQNRPQRPTTVTIVRLDATSLELEWSKIEVSPPKTVDGYWIFAWTGPNPFDRGEPEEVIPTGEGIPPSQQRFARAVSMLPPGIPFPNDTIGVQVTNGLRGVVTGLKPWTRYALLVAGYNDAGLGDPSQLTVTTLDSKDSYYILSLRIMSEAFTEDLKDRTSRRFIELERNITTEVSSLYQKHPWFKTVIVLGFRPGSVQAELQLEVASPNMSVVREVVSVMDNLGNFSLDRNVTKIRSEPGIQSVKVNVSNLMVNVSGKIVVSCAVIGGPDELNITWFKAGKMIGLTHRTKVETTLRHSLLTIRDVMPEDEGNYSCHASKGIQNGVSRVTIGVVPVLEIQPRAISKRVGDQATFNCAVVSGFRQGARVSIVEVTDRDGHVRHQVSRLTVVDLQIPGEGKSHTRRFVCEMWLVQSEQQQLLSRSEVAELIIVPPDAPKCPAQLLEGVSWSATAAGGTDVQPCPKGASGTASRECSNDASWKKASFIRCSSAEFLRLGDEIEAITEGFQSDVTPQQVLSELVNISQPQTNNSKRPAEIYGGDLVIAVNILTRLAAYNSNQGNVSSGEDVDNYAQVTSNLLDSINSKTWNKLEQAGQGRSRILVKAVDNYGLGVAATFSGSTKSKTIQTKNLKIWIERVDQASPLRVEGLNLSYQQSSIYLPPQAFHSRGSRVVSVVYLTLNDVLPLAKNKRQDKAVSPNTTVVSSTVVPRPPRVLNKRPIKIILQNRRVDVPSGVTPEATCVFWRPGESAKWQTSGCQLVPSESDVAMTTCECDHLTIFASLMDPYDSSIGKVHKRALEIISIVGCTISLLAVLITIAVTLFFWRVVRSPRAKVLLNLCAAIALSCILVITEGSARDSKAGCTVVAALLHYFLLALFSWMLCEGVLLYILLVKVFGGGAEDKVKYFYIFGWGFPAIIVAISLAATQAEGYGNTEACWLDAPSGLIAAFIAPALIIILINIVVFILVIRQMMGTRHVQSKTEVEKVKAGIKASAVILPLLGITWLFGLLGFNSATVAFKYIFAICNSLQGLMIFIFHCLLNKQIKDAIKRRREKTSSGAVSSTPKSKPSPNQKVKSAVRQGKVAAPKKRSNRAQNDYEMMDSVTTDKNPTVSTPTNSRANKNAIIDIPEDELPEVITKLREAPEELNDLPPKHDEIVQRNDGPSPVPDSEGSEEDSADGKAPWSTLLPHTEVTETKGLTREGSIEGPQRDEELVHGGRFSISGVTNHVYNQPEGSDHPFEVMTQESEPTRNSPKASPLSSSDSEEETVGFSPAERGGEELTCTDRGQQKTPIECGLPFEELSQKSEAVPLTPKVSSSSSSDSEEETVGFSTAERTGEELTCEDRGSEEEQTPDKCDLLFEEPSQKSEAACLTPKVSSSSSSDSEEETVEFSLESRGEDLIFGERGSVDEQTPDKCDPPFEEPIQKNEKARLTPKVSSSSSSSDSEEEPEEFSAEFTLEVNPGDVSCVIEEAPLEGALAPNSSEGTPVHKTTRIVEPRQVDDDVKNDEDFEIKMRDRRNKVDTLQRAADAFMDEAAKRRLSPTKRAWEKIRQKMHHSSYKVTCPADAAHNTSERREDDVEDLELV